MTLMRDVLYRTAQNLRGVRHGTTTSAGTTTTLIDTSIEGPDDYWNGGVIFFLDEAVSGETTLPAGRTATITDYASATGTLTFAAQACAPGTGKKYAITDTRWNRRALVEAINQALANLGNVTQQYSNASFVVVENQTDYTLPSGVSNVARVEISGTSASPYLWMRNQRWVEITGTIQFDHDVLGLLNSCVGNRIRLSYNSTHATVSDDTDVVTDCANIMRVSWDAAYYALLNRTGIAESSEPTMQAYLPIVEKMRAEQRSHPILLMKKDPYMAGW